MPHAPAGPQLVLTAIDQTLRQPQFTFDRDLSKHPAARYLARLSPGSRPVIATSLRVAARELCMSRPRDVAWAAARYEHMATLQARLAARHSPAYANHIVAAVRGVLREAWRLGQLSAEDYRRACDLPRVRAERLSATRLITRAELERLFDSCAQEPNAIRGAYDAALIALLYGGGLRIAETRRLTMGDYDPTDGTLLVVGKGNREEKVFLPAGACAAVEAWILESENVALVNQEAPLFFSVRTDRSSTEPIRVNGLRARFERRTRLAKVRPFTPHDLRRSYVTSLLDRGADVVLVSKLARHRQVDTTARYDRRGDDARRGATELLDVPYLSRPR